MTNLTLALIYLLLQNLNFVLVGKISFTDIPHKEVCLAAMLNNKCRGAIYSPTRAPPNAIQYGYVYQLPSFM